MAPGFAEAEGFAVSVASSWLLVSLSRERLDLGSEVDLDATNRDEFESMTGF